MDGCKKSQPYQIRALGLTYRSKSNQNDRAPAGHCTGGIVKMDINGLFRGYGESHQRFIFAKDRDNDFSSLIYAQNGVGNCISLIPDSKIDQSVDKKGRQIMG